jgi:hypothetical protein
VRRGRLRGFVCRLPGRSRPHASLAALCALAAVALAVGIILGTGTGSSQGASPAAKVSGATTVQRRNLVETDTESGTLTYANPQTVYNRIAGTVTWLASVGQLITPGHALYYVDNQPVTLFNGTTPAYRDLTSGITNGPDINELNRDLVSMGFDPGHEITLNDTWQPGTTAAIDRWQASLGETQTGSITLGRVVFLPGAQRVTTVDAVLGSTGSSAGAGAGSGSSGSSSTSGTNDPRPEFASLESTTPTTTAPTRTSPATSTIPTKQSTGCKPTGHKRTRSCNSPTEAALIALLRAETAELQKALASGSRGASGPAAAGSAAGGAAKGGGSRAGAGGASGAAGAGAGGSGAGGSGSSGGATAQPILQTTSNRLDVVVDLDATKQSEAVLGEPVTVEMPDGSVVNGKITHVSPIAQSSTSGSGSGGSGGSGSSGNSSGSPSATIPVTIELHGHLPASGLDQAAVSVNFQQQKASNVLSVPVTALLATAGGGYAVQEAAPPHRLIPITPGLFAAGYVQISGAQIYPGLQVTDSQG